MATTAISSVGQRATAFRERLALDWRRFQKFMLLLLPDKLAGAGLIIILVFIFVSIAAPLLVGSYPTQVERTTARQPPSSARPFGPEWRRVCVVRLLGYGGP